MKEQRFWGMKRSSSTSSDQVASGASPLVMIVRIGLALAAITGSLVLAWVLLSQHTTARAAGPQATTPTPAPTPPPPAGPVNKIWYFAEGRVGKSFREYLTIDNPTANACAVNIQYNYTLDGVTTPANKTVAINVPAASRVTESVNNDLGITDIATTGANVATVVMVNATSTPGCTGVVVERPMYFTNFSNIASGTDVLGATKLGTTFYFADVPNGTEGVSKFASFITILNPNAQAANVQVTYPMATPALTQTLTVPANSRGTISPTTLATPYNGHMPAIVTSNQPIVVERPTYFFDVSGVSGAYDIVGSPVLANDWLFAEGYASTTTQEFLTIANIATNNKAPASVTILLKSASGHIGTFPLTLNANTQTIFNVNQNDTFTGATPEVSAEVKTATGNPGIIVQRQMYFTYKHTLPNGRVTTAIGGTDVIGQVGPAAHSSYSFAEGYNNTGYNEWLTLQNPTAAPETIYITLVNGNQQTFTENVKVVANSRFTVDITALVLTAFNPGTSTTANSVSMTVQTLNNGGVFVAERPLYWNTAGTAFVTQGGSDILGYPGG
jgi:hypothetical protein